MDNTKVGPLYVYRTGVSRGLLDTPTYAYSCGNCISTADRIRAIKNGSVVSRAGRKCTWCE